MVTFGFSAFLKLLSLNEKPFRTELKKRLGPSTGGYDYHRSFRLHARRFLVNDDAISSVLGSAEKIVQSTERQSAVAALSRLEIWRTAHPGPVLDVLPVVFESPGHLFRIRFDPDFGLRLYGKKTAIHLWNTIKPALSPTAAYVAMALAAQACEDEGNAPEDFGVLSMRNPVKLFRLSEAADPSALARSIVNQIEEVIRGTPPSRPQPEPHPHP